MGLIVSLIIGGVVGWLASIAMKTNAQMGLIANVVIGVVGSGLSIDPQVRRVALEALAELEPELVAVGGSGTSATAVVLESELGSAVRRIHRRFFEEVSV